MELSQFMEMSAKKNAENFWLSSADSDNPAGPLYASGEFAEAEVVGAADITITTNGRCGTACSASRTHYCC